MPKKIMVYKPIVSHIFVGKAIYLEVLVEAKLHYCRLFQNCLAVYIS